MKRARRILNFILVTGMLLAVLFPPGRFQPQAVFARAGNPELPGWPVQTTPRAGSDNSPLAAPQALASKISAGYYHTCAVTSTGGVLCWGDNDFGQLGTGTTNDSLVPVAVPALSSGVTAISAGSWHTCALQGGAVKCWGSNTFGQLGNNDTEDSSTPVDVQGLSSGVTAVAAGDSHTCALTSAGAVKCWGLNDSGQLGNNSIVDSAVPVDVSGLSSGVTSVSAGGSHTCAVSSGAAVCWGWNAFGQLGNNDTVNIPPADRHIPVGVYNLSSGVSSVSAGSWHSCALTTGGAVWCWGYNLDGQLGNAANEDSLFPVAVSGLSSGAAAVTAGDSHTCARTAAGAASCWGYNGFGQLGNNSIVDTNTPVAVSGISGTVSVVEAGIFHTCAVSSDSVAWCWGDNSDGQVGDRSTTDRLTPVKVIGLGGYILPALTILDPASALAGTGGITLTVTGSDFEAGSQVYWNGAARATTFVSAAQLTAALTAADLAPVSANAVTVINPDTGGTPSNALTFNVHTFADSTPASWHWKWVEGLYAKRITGGCDINPFRYCPDRQVTRAEMAVFILKAQNVNTPGYAPSPAQTGIFADVPVAGKEWMQPWIEEFYEQGITGGCNVNPFRYCPERQVTRAEMSVFILRAVHGAGYTPPAATGIFADVPVAGKEWMQPWIEQFYREGITGGCNTSPLRFCPERQVTRAEMAAFIDRAFGFPQVP